MAELSKERMNELVNLLSANGIKYQSGFETVLNDDYSDDPSKYELVCKAIERIDILAHACVDQGVTREKRKDVFTLSKICVRLTKNTSAKKTMDLRMKVEGIAGKAYSNKNTVNVKGELLGMIDRTVAGLALLQENEEKKMSGTASYKEVAAFLSDFAEEIRACYDNSSLEAAKHMKSIYGKVSLIRYKVGMGTLSGSEFRELGAQLNEEVKAWNKLVRAGGKKAKIEDLNPGVDQAKDRQFDIKVKSKAYLEKLEILKEKVDAYKDETDLSCDTKEYEKERDELLERIKKQTAELAELKAKVVAKRMTEEEAVAKGRPIRASITIDERTLKTLHLKIQEIQMIRDPRTIVYLEIRDIAKIIESNRTNPQRLYAFTKLLDLELITQFLSGIANTDEERQAQINTIRYIRRLAERISKEVFSQADTINADTDKRLERIQQDMEQRWKAFEAQTTGSQPTVSTAEAFDKIFGDIAVDEPEQDVGTVNAGTTDTIDLEDALRLK